MTFSDDLTVKNCAVYMVAADGTLGWAFFGAGTAGKTLTLENCLMEHTRWVMVQSNDAPDTKLHISDSYFVNMTGEPCRRNGGVYDNVNYNTAEIVVENSTHVMAQGMIYKFRNYPVGKAWFNHNTFVNMGNAVFENIGYLSNYVVTNNIFVNCNVQPYSKGLDYSETDADSLPTGIINVNVLPDDLDQVARKTLVDKNVVAWSPELSDVVDQASAAMHNDTDEWYNQMITMNSRTQAMFDDDATYPYLTEGVWYEQMPDFNNSEDLFTDQLANFEEFCVATVDEEATALLPVWRLVFTGEEDYIYSDWPIPIDLSYSDAELVTGGIGGFPVGDLNWFPEQKVTWLAQKDAEDAAIQAALDAGTVVSVASKPAVPEQFNLSQNYPNPFNPSTTIEYSVPESGAVTLTVFNALGQEVATLVDGYRTAGNSYKVSFDGSGLANGVYIYTMKAGETQVSKKMILMK